MNDFDPETCITAAELRRLGAKLGEDVPDCAWTTRASVRTSIKMHGDNPRMMTGCTITITFDPLQWVTVTGTVSL